MMFRNVVLFVCLAITPLFSESHPPTFRGEVVKGFASLQTDLNGDGAPDLIGGSAEANKAAFEVALSNGDGTYQPWVSYAPLNQGEIPQSVAVGDFNGDGEADVVVSICDCAGFQPGLEVYLGNGDGTLRPPAMKISLPFGVGITATDVNHDGKQDLILLGNNAVSVMYGAGNGNFSPPRTVYTSSQYNLESLLPTGDFDGDGNADIVVQDVYCNQGQCDYRLTTLYGNGKGRFTAAHLSCNACQNPYFTTADVNQDGISDLVTFNQTFYGSSSRNYRIATFPGPASPYLTGLSVVVAADLNGDGIDDLGYLAEKQGQDGSYLAYNLGAANGKFSAPELYPFTHLSSTYLRIGDYNHDQKPDVLVNTAANQGPAVYLHFLLNTTRGNFSTCSAPGPIGVHICGPAHGAKLSSPVKFNISASAFEPVRKIVTVVDGKKMAETYYGWDVEAFSQPSIKLSAGRHHADVYAVNYDGHRQHASVDFMVQ